METGKFEKLLRQDLFLRFIAFVAENSKTRDVMFFVYRCARIMIKFYMQRLLKEHKNYSLVELLVSSV